MQEHVLVPDAEYRDRRDLAKFGFTRVASTNELRALTLVELLRHPRLFNFAVMENETKWPQWANVELCPATLTTIDWLRENGFQVRGHNLVWPSWRNRNVKAATDAKENPEALAKVILDHIKETIQALKGRVVDWHAINETFTNHDFIDILGKHAMVDWFQAARGRSGRQAVHQRPQHSGRRGLCDDD